MIRNQNPFRTLHLVGSAGLNRFYFSQLIKQSRFYFSTQVPIQDSSTLLQPEYVLPIPNDKLEMMDGDDKYEIKITNDAIERIIKLRGQK